MRPRIRFTGLLAVLVVLVLGLLPALSAGAPQLVSVSVAPSPVTVAVNGTVQLTAVGHYSDGSTKDLTDQAAWGSSNNDVLKVSNASRTSGRATGIATGTVTVTVKMGTVRGSATVIVGTTRTLSSIAVTPSNPSIAAGLTQQFTATGTYSDNSTQDLTSQVTWASQTTTVAAITTAGLATGQGQGTSSISATLSGVSGSTTLTVTAARLQSIAVTPANPSIADGLTQQFTATGTYSDSSTQDLTSQVDWSSGTAGVATITTAGLATGQSQGTSTIAATLGAVSGSTTLTVTAPVLVSIAVTPYNPVVFYPESLQVTATGTYSDGSTSDVTEQAEWSSTFPEIATVSNTPGSKGLVTAVASEGGEGRIYAQIGTVLGDDIVYVRV